MNLKKWNGHALITSLKDKSLRKLEFNDLSNVKEEIIFKDKNWKNQRHTNSSYKW